jgi:hypothetical protein
VHLFCSDNDDDNLVQLELKNQRQPPLPFGLTEFYSHYFNLISLVISMSNYF